MKIRKLLSMWEETANGELTPESYSVRLPVEDAARLKALAEMYPRRHVEELISDLLSGSLPYVRGKNIVSVDEQGDPLYEDVGPTPRYLALTRKHLSSYKQRDH